MFKNLPSSYAIMAAVFAAFGTLFFVIGAHTFYRNCQFAGHVERIAGLVTNRYITVSHGKHGSTTYFHVTYQFRDTGSNLFACSTTVTSTTYYEESVHASIPVKYLPHYPTISRIDLPAEDSNYRNIAWGFMLFGGLFGGFGWYSFFELERLIFYRRWLRKFGVRREGKVDRIEINTSLQINHRNPHYLLYSYTDATGKKQRDSSVYLSIKQEGIWSDGDLIDVYYDPRAPSKSTVILDK
jgi:uncharacterized membrane protein